MRFLILFIFLITNVVADELSEIKNIVIHKDLKTYDNLIFLDKKDQKINIKEFNGKLVLMNFWATWCEPCREEMPSLDRLQNNPKLNNLRVFTINIGNENLKKVEEILKRYPEKNKKSAVMPLLYLAQRQNDNWIPLAAMKYIANYLAMPYISVYEVATFYTMYNLAPVGKHFIQVCTTTPCLLRGADKIVKLCKENISPNENEISKKGNCSWMEVECLGACVSAPMIQINDDYYEDLDEKSTKEILTSLINDKPVKPGSYRGRKNTSPEKILISNGEKHA